MRPDPHESVEAKMLRWSTVISTFAEVNQQINYVCLPVPRRGFHGLFSAIVPDPTSQGNPLPVYVQKERTLFRHKALA